MPAPEAKSAGLAAVLSVIIPGLGQFCVGQIGKGIMFIILLLVAWGLAASLFGLVLAIPLWITLPIWAGVDAHKAACGASKTPVGTR